ncbi:MAG: hypothetical protein WBE55_09970 [Candidatus Sulfotelmatobacter sp.]
MFNDPYACTLTWFYIAGFTSARTIPLPLIQHNHPVPVSFYTGCCANFCSSACAPSAGESTWGFTPARALAREFRPHIDEQLTPPVKHQRAHLRGSAELDSREQATSLSPKSAECAVVEIHMLLPGFHKRTSTEGAYFGSVVTLWRAYSRTDGQVRSNKEEHVMSQSRGAVSFEPLFTAEDIGLRKEANVEHVMKVFITLGEGVASRWIEMPKGVLLLQSVPDDPASGAVYLYDRELQVFYFVVFDEGRDDNLTAAEFDELVTEYNLVSWTAHPALLRRAVGKPGMA